MKRHALVASYDVPRFDRDSASKRTFDLIGHLLDAGWKVTYAAVSPPGPDRAHYSRMLGQRGIAVYEGVDAAEEVIASGAIDLALFSFWQVAELLMPWVREASPETRVVVDSVDVQFVRYIRRLRSLDAGSGDVLDQDDAEEFRGEMNTYLSADAVLTVSQAEADLLATLTGQADLAYAVPDQEDLTLAGPDFADRRGLVFVGSFRWAPNVDAARFAVQEVLPLVDPDLLAEHPLSLVGDGLDGSVLETIGASPHVIPVGWVPSIPPYLYAARAAIVPLRYGAGTKRKTIQALAAGTPTVATTTGAEGLELEDGRHVLTRDDPEGLARAIGLVLGDEQTWRRLRDEGAAHMAQTRSPRVAGAALGEAIDACFSREVTEIAGPTPLRDDRLSRYNERTLYQACQAELPAIREVVQRFVPAGAVVLVVTSGERGARRFGGANAQHYPQGADGLWRRDRPQDTAELLADLTERASAGATHLLVPQRSRWFLDQYPGIDAHLDFEDEVGGTVLYRLAMATLPGTPPPLRPSSAVSVHSSAEAVVRLAEAPRLIAFYLPQFHPIAENDEWWGKGFTEWSNVAKAEPLFPRHHQPHLPADLGFYDLRVSETRSAQADLAREHGISAFCYYHYWFGGKRLLEQPFDEVLRSGEPDFPFTLCWANEPWSRRWDGMEHEVLQPQTYSPADDLEHIRWLLPALADPRAVRIAGRPLLTIYQAWALPDPKRTADTWRQEVSRAGLGDLFLCTIETGWDEDRDFTGLGFDAKIGFQPQFSFLSRVPRQNLGPPSLRVFDYEEAWRYMSQLNEVPYRRYETVSPQWDNSARRGADGWVLHDSSPEKYEEWLSQALRRSMSEPLEHRLVWINAWNEWGEGCHLEPDHLHGRGYLEATARALASVTARHGMRPAAVDRA